LSAADVPLKTVDARELVQHASRTAYRDSPLHFGADGTNRYDDPDRAYGVLYLAYDLQTVLMESLFHQHQWHKQKKRSVTRSEAARRMIRAVGVLVDLHLADLTAPDVMATAFGLNLSQLASRRYIHTQRISRTIHAMTDSTGTPLYDGTLYPSRNNYPAACIALFERVKEKVDVFADIDLIKHKDWPAFVKKYKISVFPR
jgi:RES domain